MAVRKFVTQFQTGRALPVQLKQQQSLSRKRKKKKKIQTMLYTVKNIKACGYMTLEVDDDDSFML